MFITTYMSRYRAGALPRLSAIISVVLFAATFFVPLMTEAATLRLTPSTGVYTVGATFNVSVLVDSAGKPINAAEGTLSFNPREVSVVSVNRASSIFNLWVAEPAFSNTAGTITFSGGSPSGYTGSAGNVMTITLRAVTAGSPRVSFTQGAVLANDGRGTNVLANMAGGSFTVGAPSATPEAEVIQYVPPANTPGAPSITSTTHPDQVAWYKSKTATLTWTLPTGITAVRTLLDQSPATVPTRVYEEPIRTITLSDLPEGVSYFHLQFQNADGWGRVANYRLAVDSVAPHGLTIALPEDADLSNPEQQLLISATDETSKVIRYMVKINNDEPLEFLDPDATGVITLPKLLPGYHAVIIEAFDQAGNGVVGSFSFTLTAFDRPVFTEYPQELNEGVIPVIRGETRPDADVEVVVLRTGREPDSYRVTSNEEGVFTFIPDAAFASGVYLISARATDQFGAQSEVSETIRIAVQQPGFLRIGSLLVSVLSVILSLFGLLALSIIGALFLLRYLRSFRARIKTETAEALVILKREFAAISELLRVKEQALLISRKSGALTKAEAQMLETLREALADAERRVTKEVSDVDRVISGTNINQKLK